MKRSWSLLAVAIVTAASTGCNCCPCLRNICPFGSCTNPCAPAPVTYAAVPACPPPAPVCAPAPVYAAAPAAAMPMYAAPQQYTVPQYAMPSAQPVYSEAGCGTPYAAASPCPTCSPCETSCGMAYSVADPACGCTEVGYGMAPQQMQQMMIDPGPAQ